MDMIQLISQRKLLSNSQFTFMKKILLFLSVLVCFFATPSAQAQGCSAPIINSFSPNTGFIGSTVTIIGANFDAIPANNQVWFGATQATVQSSSFGTLVVTVPVGATTAPIAVKNACNLTAYSNVSFNGIFCPTPINATTYNNTSFELTGVNGAYNMLAQDMDGDGKPDVVSAYNGLTVARNNSTPGNLNFTAFNFGNAGQYNSSISTADFDGDGKRDLFGTYNIYRNTSTGPGNINFQVIAAPAMSTGGYQGNVGDFNNDGKVDIIWENAGGTMYIYMNTSTGPGNISFAQAAVISVQYRCTGIQVVDVDGDGKVDILATQGDGNRLIALRNTTTTGAASFTFGPIQAFNSGGLYPYRCQIADFDKDGKIDLATVNYNSGLNTVNTAVFRNTSTVGAINFATPNTYPGPNNNYRIGVGDVNGDGYPDIVTKSLAVQAFAVYPNISSGPGNINFSSRFDYNTAAAAEVSGIVIGDLDGDYVPDIATSGTNSNTIRFHRNTSVQVDATPPTAACKNIIVALSPSGTATVTAAMIDNGSSDACGIGSIQINNSASVTFTCANIGANIVTLKVTDRAGNVSTCTATVTVAPAAIIVAGQTTVCQGQTVTLNANLGDSYQWYNNGVAISGATSQNYIATVTGDYTVAVTNAGGCSGSSAPTHITVNLNPTVNTSPSGAASLCPPGNLTISASTSSIYQWKLNGNNISGATQQTYNATGAGSYSVQVVDLFGCSATSAAVVVNATDNIPPTAICKNVTVVIAANGTASITAASINNGSFDNCTLASVAITSGKTSYTCADAGQTFPVTLTVTDAAGNSSFCVAQVSVTDPNTVCNRPPVAICKAITLSANSNCEASATAAAFDGGSSDPDAGDVLTFSVSPAGPYAKGTTSVTFTVTDQKGASSSCSTTITVVDDQAPVIVCPPSQTVNNNTNQCGAVVTYTKPTATDNCSGSAFNFFNNGEPNNAGSEDFLQLYTSGTWNDLNGGNSFIFLVEFNSIISTVFPGYTNIGIFGGHTYYKSTFTESWQNARNAALSIGGDLASINTLGESQFLAPHGGSTWVGGYQDHSDPSYVEPGNASQNFGGWKWVDGTKLGAGQIAIIQTAGLPSGSLFPIGTTVNTFKATDESGNFSTCSFSVTVIDNQFPTLACPSAITHSADLGQCTYSFTPATPGASDNCPGVTVSGVRGDALALNAPYPKGITTITWTATDASNNKTTCTQTVTVTDNEKPTIVCATSQTINLDANCNAFLPDYRNLLTASDNCTPANALVITQSPVSGTTISGAGTQVITFTVSDAAGNFSTCTMTLTKLDVTPPTITCPQPIAVNTDPNVCGAIVNFGTSALYASSSTGLNAGSLFSVNTTTGVATLIGANLTGLGSNRVTSLAKDPLTGTLYGVIGGSANLGGYLIKINPSTGAGTLVGVISGPGFNGAPGVGGADALAFDASGNLYSSGWNGGSNYGGWFMKLNKATGAVTQSFNVGAEYTGLAFSPSGVLYASRGGNNPGNIHTINPANGAILTTIHLSDGSARITDLAFNSNGTLYGSLGGSFNNLVTINTTSGAITTIGSFGSAVQNIAGLTFMSGSGGSVPATDNCSANVTVIQTAGLPSGSLFPVGTTTNTFEASDASGNKSTCSFTVTVTDNQNPVINGTPANITKTNDAGVCGAKVTWTAATATDNCPGVTISSDHQSGDLFPVGTTTVTYTAKDAYNHVVTTSFTVTVTDDEKPVILNLPASFSVNALNNNCSNLVTWTRPTATDNCGIASLTSSDPNFDILGFTLLSVGVNTITYTAIDIHGNKTTASFTITIVDNQPPIITGCPADQTVNAANGRCDNVVIWNPPTASDNCPGVSLSTNHISGETFPVGTTLVTYTATDHAGLITTCSFNVTVLDNQPPVIVCPASISVSNDAGTCGASVMITNATATDNCPGVTVAGVRSDALPLNAAYPVGTTTITWTATDAHTNTSTCSQTVIVTDTEKPVIIGTPANITQTNDAGVCGAKVSWIAATASDNCPGVTISSNYQPGDLFPVGTTTVTYTATDAHGNTVTTSFTVTVTDDENPVIVGTPANITQTNDAGVCGAKVNWTAATATDNCPGVTISSNYQPGDLFPVGTTTVTYTAKDAYGHVVTTSFTVTVTDDENPVIVGTPANITQTNDAGVCGAKVSWIAATATDNCPGVTISSNYQPGDLFPVGTTTVTYTAKDAYGHVVTTSFTVTVTDDENPVILGTPSNITKTNDVGVCGAKVSWTAATATDNCPGVTISSNYQPGDLFPVGTTTVTYTAKDAYGHVVTTSFTVTVTDDENPVIIATPSNITKTNDAGVCGAKVSWIAATAKDNCPGVTISSNYQPGDLFPVGTTTVTYTAKDAYGHVVTSSFTVKVTDDENPVIVGTPANITQTNDAGVCGAKVSWTAATAKDNCPGVTISSNYQPGDLFPVGTTTVTYTATDAYGHVVSTSFTVTVTDDENPVIVGTPANITQTNDAGVCGAKVSWTAATAKDNCPGVTISSNYQPGYLFPVGTTTVTYTAKDAYGHVVTTIFTVTVTDNEKPKANCKPVTVTLVNGTASITVASINNNSTDNCGIATMTVSKSTFSCLNIGANAVTLTVTDIYGNVSSCVATVTVVGEIPACSIASIPTSSTYTGGVSTSLFLGYGAQSTTLKVTPAANGAPYTYSWSGTAVNMLSSTTSDAPVFTPTAAGTYTFTVVTTNKYGCTTSCSISICVTDIKVYASKHDDDDHEGDNDDDKWKSCSHKSHDAKDCTHKGHEHKACDHKSHDIKNCPDDEGDNEPGNDDDRKVYLCHVPNGNQSKRQTISISVHAVAYHLAKHPGDRLGSCDQLPCSAYTDKVNPDIDCPKDVKVSCTSSLAPSVTGTATATDNYSAVTITYTDVTVGNKVTRTWKATDAAGNFATCQQTITVGEPFSTSLSSVPNSNVYTGEVPTNLYLGYGAQSTTLKTGSLSSSGAPYTYAWSGSNLSSTSSSAPVFTPTASGTYAFAVTITNVYGCKFSTTISLCVTDIRVPGTGGTKVFVCHTPKGKNTVSQTLQVLVSQVPSHIGSNSCGGNGTDRLGSCEQSPCSVAVSTAVIVSNTSSVTKEVTTASTTEEELKVTVSPNPTATYFTLKLESKYQTPVNLRVMDGRGRVIDSKTQIGSNSTFQIGHTYSSGTYYAELIQGTKRKVVQLIKVIN
jgi:hypothetical protein